MTIFDFKRTHARAGSGTEYQVYVYVADSEKLHHSVTFTTRDDARQEKRLMKKSVGQYDVRIIQRVYDDDTTFILSEKEVW